MAMVIKSFDYLAGVVGAIFNSDMRGMNMKIELSPDEVKEALADAVAEKVSHIYGEINPDECWFNVVAGDGFPVDEIDSVSFVANIDQEKRG